ncbi:uncharacterized protein LOC132621070 [Lycium barbarum]|uniref:uncharacterized protein LOC132621070 n=1 Tax=Lycium barbarum TaxID=112863 RepID=UPI00293EAD7B|nr:uncharacterized protein LOC132621070 [Lycium barbarum]
MSDPPPEPENTTFSDFINDLIALLDALGISKVTLVAKDFGAELAQILVLLHPERTSHRSRHSGSPFTPLGPRKFVEALPEGLYISRWQEPGRAEADFGRFDFKTVLRNIYILFSRNDIQIAALNQEIMDLVDSSTPLPPWFSDEDLSAYGALYEKSGFRTALQVPYRSLNEEFNISNQIIEVPALLIMGEKDYTLKFPGIQDYIRSGRVKYFATNLEIVYLPEGSHFVQEQLPDQVNELILKFLKSHS